MSLKAAGSLAADSMRAALTVVRWSLGMMLLGALLSVVCAVLLLDETRIWIGSGAWGWLAALLLVLALLLLPWIWGWLGRAYGIRKAFHRMLHGRSEAALQLLLQGVAAARVRAGADPQQAELTPQLLIGALRKPSTLKGLPRWLAWLLRHQLDLDRTLEHLQQAQARALSEGQPAQSALAAALAADLGERWLQPDPSLLWALGLAQVIVLTALSWLW